ncbi:MAG: cupin domain-containing protein [Alphaproteobacteria bacterium]|nr:cupin domain-containing protein [Alphaproteobacteria bacterium]
MAQQTTERAAPEGVDAFIDQLGDWNLIPGWKVLAREVPPEPSSAAIPYLWRYSDIKRQLSLAGELVPPDEAERRVLVLANPGLDGRPATTPTMFTDIQLVLPGEETNTHRHTPTAIRFMLEGEGSYAMTAGERMSQAFGDLVLGPSWGWHSHGNPGESPAIWFDALDIPLVKILDASFFEPYPDEHHPETQPYEASLAAFGNAALLPSWDRPTNGAASPLLKYQYAAARPALMGLAEEKASPYDDMILEYVHPATGGPCTPTMACYLQRLRPEMQGKAHRHTSSAVYVVAEGRGRTVINGEPHDWQKGDVLALPSWCWHNHENTSAQDDAILFSVTDRPVLNALGLYREEAQETA